MQFYSLADFFYGPIVFLLIIFLSRLYVKGKKEKNPIYQYYLPGLYVKLFGGISLCLVYTIYYPGGDTLQYFNDAVCFVKLLFYNPQGFYTILFNPYNSRYIVFFSTETGYPAYFRNAETWFVVKSSFIFVLLGMRSFIASTLLLATFSFLGVWRLFKVFANEFPEIQKTLAIPIFFMPSVFFWGSGMLKDTFTFAGIGYFVYGFYMAFILRRKIVINLIMAGLAAGMILSIKPYIFVGLMPGVIFWAVHKVISQIKGGIARFATIPLFLILGGVFGYILMILLQGQLQEYSLDKVLKKAVTTQRDLKMDYYQGNSFDIGDFDANIPSMLSKAPAAIFATFFRPFILEANNAVMFLSSLENLWILILTIRTLIMVKVYGIFKYFLKHHLLTFSLVFSIFFALSVGISTSNFGSLVRYKIPCIPFFVSSLFIIRYLRQKELDENAIKTDLLLNPETYKKIENSIS